MTAIGSSAFARATKTARLSTAASRPFHTLAAAVVIAAALSFSTGVGAQDVVPLPHAHAHNDYEHERPLLDALDHGFCSIEADIFAVNGELLVAHDADKVSPDRTLRGLYLDPLLERVRANGGRVYPNGPTVILLIDFKSGPAETWPLLKSQLEAYAEMLTVYSNEGIEQKAVSVILSGDSPRDLLAAEPVRLAALDGRLPDLDANPPISLVPLVSADWMGTFQWAGKEDMPGEVELRLREIALKAKEQGRMTRFWAAPQNPYVWGKCLEADVTLLNADNLGKLREYLLEQR